MGLIDKAYETYQNHLHMVGVDDCPGKAPLAPVGFIPAKAAIEVSISKSGEFIGARRLGKDEMNTLIPVTDASAVRTSGIAAHPLCDQLEYCAKGVDEKKFAEYIEALAAWASSEYTHPIVDAVYKYCEKGGVLSDLAGAGIIKLENNKPNEKGLLVRWNVVGVGKSYEDSSFFETYARYNDKLSRSKIDVDYITGKTMRIADSHPKGTLVISNGAKLISANDSSGFTYRGRFTTSGEALAVGYEVSQKAHAALRYLADRQGVTMGGRTYIAWNSKGKDVPKADCRFDLYPDAEEEKRSYTQQEYRTKLYRALSGYRQNFDPDDGVEIVGLEAATTGRLSVTYFNELRGSDYLDRIEKWYDECCWFKRSGGEYKVLCPSVKEIINYAFGTEQGNFVKADDKMFGEQSQRLLCCIVDCAAVPFDIVRAMEVKAACPQSYSKGDNYERLLSVACALLRKYYFDHHKEEVQMALNEKETDRSYLYGRLLAVLEKVERSTYQSGESREPNAIRLQSMFVNRPLDTFAVLEDALNPYYAQLKPASRAYYKKLVGDIVCALADDENCNAPLESKYLFGYYLQRKELYNTNNKKDREEDHETN